MTSPRPSTSQTESTPDYVNGRSVQLPIPETVTADPITIQQIATTLFSVISLGLHLWRQHKGKK